ncbi:baeRF3 domain-containing protein [Ferruginibacter profundus]
MNKLMTPEIREITTAVHYRPAVSIIMPFDPKMGLKNELAHSLKIVTDRVEQELRNNYPDEIYKLVIQKLRALIKNLNYNTLKKSIAIYVSPVFEKVLYLDIPVEEKTIIDESFEIRDLVYSKKQLHKYLVLLLSGKESQVYLGNSDSFVKIASNVPESIEGNEATEKVANFTAPAEYKEIQMEKFLHHIDHVLDNILTAYPLPLFVLGTKRVLGHFNSLTKHKAAVVEYIYGNYEEAGLPKLREILLPYITNWKKIKQKDILNQIEEAAGDKKLAYGMQDVWREAMSLKGKLLIVEKDFMYPAEHGGSEDVIYKADERFNKFSYIKDAVDDVMEKVLEKGGDVEFVDKDVLKDYQKIALIKYY